MTDCTRIATWPCEVNLKAFDSRFFRICCRRFGSLVNDRGRVLSMSMWKPRLLDSARWWNERSTVSRSAWNVMSSASTVTVPDSIFERSRMSLISVNRSVPAE